MKIIKEKNRRKEGRNDEGIRKKRKWIESEEKIKNLMKNYRGRRNKGQTWMNEKQKKGKNKDC